MAGNGFIVLVVKMAGMGHLPFNGVTMFGRNFYGTTEAGGGDFGGGIVFKLVP